VRRLPFLRRLFFACRAAAAPTRRPRAGLTPSAGDTSRAGLDGEEVPNGAMQAEIFQGALRIFAAPPHPAGADNA